MRTSYRWLSAAFAASLSIVGVSSTASANNRSFDALLAVPVDAPTSSCFDNHHFNNTWNFSEINRCSGQSGLVLPMTADGAAWYAGSVYGQGWRDAQLNPKTITCQINSSLHDGSFFWGGWVSLPPQGFGGPQVISLGSAPVYAPGDALFSLCWMDFNTTIFSYGWN